MTLIFPNEEIILVSVCHIDVESDASTSVSLPTCGAVIEKRLGEFSV